MKTKPFHYDYEVRDLAGNVLEKFHCKHTVSGRKMRAVADRLKIPVGCFHAKDKNPGVSTIKFSQKFKRIVD